MKEAEEIHKLTESFRPMNIKWKDFSWHGTHGFAASRMNMAKEAKS